MVAIPQKLLAKKVGACKTAASTKEKGEALEELGAWLFAMIPGLQVSSRNTFSDDDSQEVDVVLWNDQERRGLPSLSDRLLVECKNWTARLGSAEVAWFVWKMRRGNTTDGFLLAANGLTGDVAKRQDAWAVVSWANTLGSRIVLLTLEDISQLVTTQQFVRLIKDRLTCLASGVDPFTLPFPPA